MSKNHTIRFNKAYSASKLSNDNKYHIGCVAVYHGKIISSGYNNKKTHPIQKKYNKYRKVKYNNHIVPQLHAEIMCLLSIKNLNIKWDKVSLYIYRSCTNGLGMARPCPACMAAIKELGIKNIYYTTDNGYAYEKHYVKLNKTKGNIE